MKQVKEVSKGLIGKYLKTVPVSAADAGRKSGGGMGIGPEDQKKNQAKGIKTFVNRHKGTAMAVDKMTGKAKVPAKESFVIPEDIPVGERNAFMGAAAAAHKSGKSHFTFGGKKHPVTMKKDTARAVNSSTSEAKRTVHSDKEDRLVTMKIKNPKKKPGETATMNPKLDSGSKSKESEMEQKQESFVGVRGSDGKAMDMPARASSSSTYSGRHNDALSTLNRMANRHEKEHEKSDHMGHSDALKAIDHAGSKLNKHGPDHANFKSAMDKAHAASKTAMKMNNESLTIRDKLIAVLEGDRSAHYKGATPPEDYDEKEKNNKGAMDMKKVAKDADKVDKLPAAFDDVSKAGRAGPSMKARSNDKKDGDKNIINPAKDTTKGGMKEETRDQLAGIKAAYASMYEEEGGNVTTRHDVTGDSKSDAMSHVKKHAGSSVKVKHHGMTPNGDHDISVTGHPKHVMKFVNHHEDEKYSHDHKGHAQYKKDFG